MQPPGQAPAAQDAASDRPSDPAPPHRPTADTEPPDPGGPGGDVDPDGPGGPGRRDGSQGPPQVRRGASGLPLPPVLLALTVVSGIVDAVSFLALGRVFTANMTGNVAVLGFAAAGARTFSWPHALASLGAFLAGSTAGGWAGQRYAGRAGRTWLRLVFAVEAVLLGTAAAVAATEPGLTSAVVYALIVLTAVAMGLRNATVRRLGLADLTTTVLTMTLTGLAADSPLAGGHGTRTARRLGSVLALLGGAVLGGRLVLDHGPWLPLLIAAAVSGAVVPVTSWDEPVPRRGPASR
jgi:uncharacterized membrane protein YoaK (UPF0700 family)